MTAPFFDERVTMRENSYARYRAGVDSGLAVTVKEGKAALVQNPKAGSGENSTEMLRWNVQS